MDGTLMHPRSRLLSLVACLALAPGQPARGERPVVENKKAPGAGPAARTDRFGDRLPPGAIARLGTVRFRPGIAWGPFALSPDGRTVATGEEGKLLLWDLASGKGVRSFELQGALYVRGIRFSPDGKLVAVLGGRIHYEFRSWRQEHFVYVGEVASGKTLHRFGGGSRIFVFDPPDFVPRGKALAARTGTMLYAGAEGALVLWDPISGKELRRFPEVLCSTASPDGLVLAGAKRDGTIYLWDAATGREVRRLPGHRDAVWALAFSPDGKTLASGGGPLEYTVKKGGEAGSDTVIRLWAVSAGKEQARCQGHRGAVRLIRFAPDGKTLASEGADNALILWEASTGRRRQRVVAEGNAGTWCFRFSPDGKTLVGGHDRDGRIHHWDITAGKEVRRWDTNQRRVSHLEFTPDGKTLVAGGEWLSAWDVASGAEMHARAGHRAEVCGLKFSPDGRALASLDESHFLRVWEPGAGLPLPLPDGGRGRVHRFDYCADGKALAAVGFDVTARVWQVQTGRQMAAFPLGTAATVRAWEELTGGIRGHPRLGEHPDKCLVFGPGARVLAVAGEDHHIHLWEVAAGKKIARLDARQGRLSSLAFSPGGNVLASAGAEQTLVLWELPAGKEIHRFTEKEGGDIPCCFSPDGKTLAWAGGRRIHLWDLTTRKEVGPLPGHPGRTTHLAFDRGGRTLVSGGRDQTVCLWDSGTRRERRRMMGSYGEFIDMQLRPAPDGRMLVALSMPTREQKWSLREAATGREIATTAAGWREPFTISPDGRTFAQWSEVNGTAVFKETATGGDLGELPTGHRGRATALAFSPDGKTLATGGADTTVLVWDWERACGLAAPPPRRAGPREREGLWEGLASTDSRQAYRAAAALAASGAEAVRFLQGRVRPASDEEARPVRRLLAELDSDEFAVRERATGEMEKLGAEAEPALRQALAGPLSLEVRRRVEPLLRSPARTRWSVPMLRRLRAVQALERAGTPAARQALAALARGTPEARLTEEAQAALERLAHRPVAAP
jgi:WD40 repeat protein